MFKDLLTKFSLNFRSEDIIFGFRKTLGIIDVQSIERYLEKHDLEHVFIFTEEELTKPVKEGFDKIKNLEIIISNNMQKSMKEIEYKFKDKKIRKVDLDDFGVRPIQRDAC
jgi:hypothetical protein